VLKIALTVAVGLVAALLAVPAGAAAASASPVVHTVWLSVASVSSTTTDDVNTVPTSETQARQFVAQMNDYWSRESGGAVSIVLGGFESRSLSASCSMNSVFAKAPLLAFAGKLLSRLTRTHLLTLTREDCGVGMGSLGGVGGTMVTGVGTSADYGLAVAVHEFGHNLGFDHANATLCRQGVTAALSACATTTYADQLDVMASAAPYAVPHLSSPQRIRAGYMTDYLAMNDRSGLRTATILPLGRATGTRALAISAGTATYYVEYRTADDADATSPEFSGLDACASTGTVSRCFSTSNPATGGVRVLRVVDDATTVLAVGPMTGLAWSNYRDMHLDAGESFATADGSFALRVDSLDPAAGAGVTVAFGATPLPAPAESAVVPAPPAPQTVAPVTSALVDSTPVAADTSVPATTVTPPTPAPTTPVTPLRAPVQQAPATSRLESTTSLTIAKRTVSRSKRVVVTIRVASEDIAIARPSGRVTVFVDGKKLTTFAIGTRSKTVKLPARMARGVHRITAAYGGTTEISGSSSKSMRIRVT
jgi:hypothetical protein